MSTPDLQTRRAGPLEGFSVLELGQLLAGPWAGAFLAYFGADVIKVEAPSGDPLRTWRGLDETGTSYWWRSVARNKRCITLDLREAEGRAIAQRLASRADVLIENFRPGTMERWGLGPDALAEHNPGLVFARVSGFGQDGPARHWPGYASIAEAIGGLRHLTGHPGDAPVRPNLSLGDTLAGLHTALGVLVALLARERGVAQAQVVDTALTESVLAVLESAITESAATGEVRGPSGTAIGGIVPSNLYPCLDGAVVIGANGESLFGRLLGAIGHSALRDDPRFVGNPARVAHAETIDALITEWTAPRTVADVTATLRAAEVPCGPINDAAAIRADPQFRARGVFEQVDGFELTALPPRLGATPGKTRWAGRALGADTDAVLGELGLSAAEVSALRQRGVV